MEELQSLSQAERKRIVRKKPVVVVQNNFYVNDTVQQVLQVLSEEDEVEKSKIAKVYQAKGTKYLSLGIRKLPLNELLKGQKKPEMNFRKRLGFSATSRMFTREDSNRMAGRNYTDTLQCSVVKLSALNRETREMVMDQLIPIHQKELMKYNEDEEVHEDEAGASQSRLPWSWTRPRRGEMQYLQLHLTFSGPCDQPHGSITSYLHHLQIPGFQLKRA